MSVRLNVRSGQPQLQPPTRQNLRSRRRDDRALTRQFPATQKLRSRRRDDRALTRQFPATRKLRPRRRNDRALNRQSLAMRMPQTSSWSRDGNGVITLGRGRGSK